MRQKYENMLNFGICNPFMKIKISDFFIEKTPIYGSEEEIIYDDPLLKAEEVWKDLSIYYEKKIKEESKQEIKEVEFNRFIELSKIENYIALTGMDLVNKNVLKLNKITENKQESVNIKQYILKELKHILKIKKEEIIKNINDESVFYKRITSVFSDIIYEDEDIKLSYDNINYISYNDVKNEEKYEMKGVSCILRYKGLEFVYSNKVECKNEFERIKEYFFEKQAVQDYKKGYLEVKIVNEQICGSNEICKCIITEMRNGKTIDQMYEKILVGICRYLLDRLLLNKYKDVKIIEGSTVKKIDGRSDLYIITADDADVYKVKYYKDSFDIFLNGSVIIFESLSKI